MVDRLTYNILIHNVSHQATSIWKAITSKLISTDLLNFNKQLINPAPNAFYYLHLTLRSYYFYFTTLSICL